jgi:acetyl esterase/lipase
LIFKAAKVEKNRILQVEIHKTKTEVVENDILRDEGEVYGRKLAESGVGCYNATIHDFGLLNALAETPETRSLFIQAAAQIKKHPA